MQMTPGEIVKSYREAKEKKKQIQILAELNACSTEFIKQIMRENGVQFPGPSPKKAPKEPAKKIENKIKVPAAVRSAVLTQLQDINTAIKDMEEKIEHFRQQANELKTWLQGIE